MHSGPVAAQECAASADAINAVTEPGELRCGPTRDVFLVGVLVVRSVFAEPIGYIEDHSPPSPIFHPADQAPALNLRGMFGTFRLMNASKVWGLSCRDRMSTRR